MKKEIQTQGIVLKIYPLGETSQKIVLLDNEGLLNFIAYGKQKSLKNGKLFFLLFAQFHLREKKGLWTLLEINEHILFENLSTDITKFYIASILTEIALHSYSASDLFPLFLETLKTLNKVKPQISFYILLQFWWRWIFLNGEQSDLNYCSFCGKKIKEVYFFAHTEEGFLCSFCSNNFSSRSLYKFNQGIKLYLETSLRDTPQYNLKGRLNNISLENLSSYLCQKVQNILKWELRSWKMSKDFILPASRKI